MKEGMSLHWKKLRGPRGKAGSQDGHGLSIVTYDRSRERGAGGADTEDRRGESVARSAWVVC